MNNRLRIETLSPNSRFASAWKFSSGFCRKMQAYRNVCLCSLLFALAFFAIVSTVSAQPAMSRGQQILSISYDDCLRRGHGAFSAEGWVNIGTNGNAVNAFKGDNGSYIVCNP